MDVRMQLSVYWPSLPRPEMAKVIVCVVSADCCVMLAECCVVLVLELQATRLSRATDAIAIGTRLVLVLAMARRPTSPGTAAVGPDKAGLVSRDRAPHRSLRSADIKINACYTYVLGIGQRLPVISR
jgi:hypothetical protein